MSVYALTRAATADLPSSSSSSLSTHGTHADTRSRKGSQLATYEQLARLPQPAIMGPWHKPVPHHRLIDALRAEASRRDFTLTSEQYALSKTGAALFGVMDLRRQGDTPDDERGLSFGFRNATDQQFGLSGVAGGRVFVCDNLTLSGDLIAFSRKNTTRLDLGDAIALGFDKFIQHTAALEIQLLRLQATPLDDPYAKQIVYDLFAARILPFRLFDDVHANYFTQTDDRPDCLPRSLWGLHNACTRAIQDLTPIRAFSASTALGRAFDLRTISDAEIVTEASDAGSDAGRQDIHLDPNVIE